MPNTREKLIELINEAEEYATDICVLNDTCEDCIGRKYGNQCRDYLKADRLIANGVTLANQVASSSKQLASNEWISVKDRLPDESGLVIGYDIVWGVGCFYYHTDMQTSTWQQITHWMPLPQPPKELDPAEGR